jgi:phosphoribosylanthranilate isomerase
MERMTRIKICGIRSKADADLLNRYLPDYAGFVFAQSRRQVDVKTAQTIAAQLDARILKAGVFANENVCRTAEAALACGLDVVQLHGGEPDGYATFLRKMFPMKEVEIWKAVRADGPGFRNRLKEHDVDAFVLDSASAGAFGGTGTPFDWQLAAGLGASRRIVLAGGLDAGNVAEAIRTVQPYAVDVSSGVESGGCKEGDKVRDFITAVRSMEQRNEDRDGQR